MPDMDKIDDHEDKNYDIRDILAQAKEENDEIEESKPRSLKDIDFDGLRQRLNNREKYKNEDVEKDLNELKELIVITSYSIHYTKLYDWVILAVQLVLF